MSYFEKKYAELDDISKMAINAYRSARQFKSVGDKTFNIFSNPPTIIAAIVNEIFACELFFKSLIMIKNKNTVRGHLLNELYDLLDESDIKSRLANYNVEEEIEKISNSFQNWRYSYEQDELMINKNFVYDLCKILEIINKEKILNSYGLDMNQSFL